MPILNSFTLLVCYGRFCSWVLQGTKCGKIDNKVLGHTAALGHCNSESVKTYGFSLDTHADSNTRTVPLLFVNDV